MVAPRAVDVNVVIAAVGAIPCPGFFLVLAQPFRLGDKVAVSCTVPVGGSTHTSAAAATVNTPSGTATAAAATAANGYSSQHSSQGGGRGAAAGSSSGSSGLPGCWFEGVCEKVDLRYTVLRWVAGFKRLQSNMSSYSVKYADLASSRYATLLPALNLSRYDTTASQYKAAVVLLVLRGSLVQAGPTIRVVAGNQQSHCCTW